MTVARLEPWSMINLLHRDLERLRGGEAHYGESGDTSQTVTDWVPAVDVVEEKDRFVLRADLPGVVSEDIDVNMEDGLLTLSGERRSDRPEAGEGARRFERATGRFYRRFTLPEAADADAISARYTNGVLEISIPKQPQVQARRITVEAA